MTVGELIAELQKHPPESPVFALNAEPGSILDGLLRPIVNVTFSEFQSYSYKLDDAGKLSSVEDGGAGNGVNIKFGSPCEET